MDTNKFKYLICVFIFALPFGCTKPVDFNQLDDLKLEPVFESSIIFYKAVASDFFDNGMQQNVVQDFVDIDVFNDSFIQDNLIKVEFVFEVKNSINRAFELQLDFLDELGQPLVSFIVDTPASPNNEVIITEHVEVFEGALLESLKQSRLLVFTLEMQSGAPINQNSPGEIELKSKGVFYLSVEK